MKKLIGVLAVIVNALALGAYGAPPAADAGSTPAVHRYLVERTFPTGALKGLNSATKKQVNANNGSVGVRWLRSYANADETKTFCFYEAPSEAAIRKACELNKLLIDSITEVPITVLPK